MQLILKMLEITAQLEEILLPWFKKNFFGSEEDEPSPGIQNLH